MSHLGDAFMAGRLERKRTLGQLARLAGYRNLTRGANRIHGFERTPHNASHNVVRDYPARIPLAVTESNH